MTSKPALFGLADAGQAVRYSFLTVALWWGGFTVFTVLWVPEARVRRDPKEGGPVRAGFRQLGRTLKKIRSLKTVLLFLLAYWCYIDGVDTIIRMAVDYGMSLGFESTQLVLALLMVQFIGFPAALAFGRLGQWWGVRRAIFLALGIYMAVSVFGMFITSAREFYLLAAAVGLVQGGIQALSRSFYSRLIPPGQAAEFYGFYNMLGKFAAIIGPVLMGLVGLAARTALIPPGAGPEQIQAAGRLATRLSIGSVLILFLVGFFLFRAVDEDKGRAEAARFVLS
jgi:UMF1 family MFS transporter